MDNVQAALAKVEAEIEALGVQLNEVVEEVKVARALHNEAEVAELRKKEDKLRTEKQQLRTEKQQLRTEKQQLRAKEDKLLAKELLLLERLGVLRWLQITHLDN
jgi:chromosome segregation ATPase